MTTRKSRTMSNTSNEKMESRVGRLEGVVTTLSKEVQAIGNNLDTLVAGFSDFKESVLNSINRSSQPKYGLIIGIGTLILTVFTLVGGIFAFVASGQSSAIKDNQNAIIVLEDKLYNEKYEHGKLVATVERLERDLEILQREKK